MADTPNTDQDAPVSPVDANQLGNFLSPSGNQAEGTVAEVTAQSVALPNSRRVGASQAEAPALDFATSQGLQLLHEATSYLRQYPEDLGLQNFLLSLGTDGQMVDQLPRNVSRTSIINELLIWARKEVIDAENDQAQVAKTRVTNLTAIIPLLPAIETELTLATTQVRQLETQALSLRLPIATILADQRHQARNRSTHSLDYIYGKFNDYLNTRNAGQFRSRARLLAEHRREEAELALAESIDDQVRTWRAKTDAPPVEQLNRLTSQAITRIAQKAVAKVINQSHEEATETLKASLHQEITQTMSPNAPVGQAYELQIAEVINPIAEEHAGAIVSAQELHSYVENASFRYAAAAALATNESQVTLRNQLQSTLAHQLSVEDLATFETSGGLDQLVYLTHGLALVDPKSVEGAALAQTITSFLESSEGKQFLPPTITEEAEPTGEQEDQNQSQTQIESLAQTATPAGQQEPITALPSELASSQTSQVGQVAQPTQTSSGQVGQVAQSTSEQVGQATSGQAEQGPATGEAQSALPAQPLTPPGSLSPAISGAATLMPGAAPATIPVAITPIRSASQLVASVVSFATQTPVHQQARDLNLGIIQLNRLPEEANSDSVKETTAHMSELHTQATQSGASILQGAVKGILGGMVKGMPGQLNAEVNEFDDRPSASANSVFTNLVKASPPQAFGMALEDSTSILGFARRADSDPEMQFAILYYLNADRIRLAIEIFSLEGNSQAVSRLQAIENKGRHSPLLQEILHDKLKHKQLQNFVNYLNHFQNAKQARALKIARIFYTHPLMKYLVNHSISEAPAVFVRWVQKKIVLKTGQAAAYLGKKGYYYAAKLPVTTIRHGYAKWRYGYSPFQRLKKYTANGQTVDQAYELMWDNLLRTQDRKEFRARIRSALKRPFVKVGNAIKMPAVRFGAWTQKSRAGRIATAPVRKTFSAVNKSVKKTVSTINKLFKKFTASKLFKSITSMLGKIGGAVGTFLTWLKIGKYSWKLIKKLAKFVGGYLLALYLWLLQIGWAAVMGATIGSLVGLIGGAIVGAKIGFLVASAIAPFMGPFAWVPYAVLVPSATIIGALAGTAVGASIGAIIGATLQYMGATHLAGAIAGGTLGATIGFWVTMPFIPFGGPVVGALVGAVAGAAIGSLVQFVADRFFSSDAGTATQISIHNTAANIGDAARTSITRPSPQALADSSLESTETTPSSLGRGGAGAFSGSSVATSAFPASVVGVTVAIGIAVGIIIVTTQPPTDTSTSTTHRLVLTAPDKVDNNAPIGYKLAATIISCDTTVTIDDPLPPNTDLTTIHDPVIKTSGKIIAIEASASGQKLIWKLTMKQPNCTKPTNQTTNALTISSLGAVTPFSLTPDFCQGANPNGCSPALKSLLESAAAWANMPAGVLAGIANQEWKATFRHTDDEIRDWSNPGVIVEPNGPANHPSFQNGCALSFAFAEGPFQFLTGKGGYPNIWQSYKGAAQEAGIRQANYEGQACNVADAAFGAAKKLKSNSSMKFTDRKDVWSQDDVYQVARAYLGACVPNYNQNINYCEGVWQYYRSFTPHQL